MTDTARLSRAVLPISYDLTIETDADIDRFSGQVTIALEITEPTTTIVLHAKDLEVGLGSLTQGGNPVPARLSADAATERITVQTDRALDEGPAELQLRFGAPVSRGLLGYYRSTYVDGSRTE